MEGDSRGDVAPRCRAPHAVVTSFVVDANVLIRHLTRDSRGQSARATRALDTRSPIVVSDVVLAECVHVLESFYKTPRELVVRSMRSLLALPTAEFASRGLLERTLELYEHVPDLDYPDAYTAALAERDDAAVLSFDRDFRRLLWIDWIEP